MDKAIAAARVRVAFGDAAGLLILCSGLVLQAMAWQVFSSQQRQWQARSSRRCSHLSGYAAGFGLTEVLVSAVLLGIFS